MALFEKKTTIYRKKDSETWKKMKEVLKAEGFKGVHASHVYADPTIACGCGSHLDPRDFGPNGKIDRDVYFIEVRKEDADRARKALIKHGLVPVVDMEAERDITQKSHPAV